MTQPGKPCLLLLLLLLCGTLDPTGSCRFLKQPHFPPLPSIPGTMWGEGSLGVAVTAISQRRNLQPCLDFWPIPVHSQYCPHMIFFFKSKVQIETCGALLNIPFMAPSCLEQRSENIFCKGPHGKYCGLRRPRDKHRGLLCRHVRNKRERKLPRVCFINEITSRYFCLLVLLRRRMGFFFWCR